MDRQIEERLGGTRWRNKIEDQDRGIKMEESRWRNQDKGINMEESTLRNQHRGFKHGEINMEEST